VILQFGPVARSAAVSLAPLHRACFPEDPWDAATIAEILALPGFFGQIAADSAAPAGFVLALDLGNEAEILSLGVLPERRRSGVGNALVEAVCAAARRRRAERVVLEVAVDNAAARRLYAACGFVAVGRRANYYRRIGGTIDALILSRALIIPAPSR
jgi:[ribosomal protein S18]-alanine N-acetyltransferase